MRKYMQNTQGFLYAKNTKSKTPAQRFLVQKSLFYPLNILQRFIISILQLCYTTPLYYSFQRNNCQYIYSISLTVFLSYLCQKQKTQKNSKLKAFKNRYLFNQIYFK